jgi:isopentenyl diphosphate isomerase/L-lactate dehydrogenase-like FMN-dependent dehydrogenase
MVVGVARIPNFLKTASPAGSWEIARNRMKFLLRKAWNLGLS